MTYCLDNSPFACLRWFDVAVCLVDRRWRRPRPWPRIFDWLRRRPWLGQIARLMGLLAVRPSVRSSVCCSGSGIFSAWRCCTFLFLDPPWSFLNWDDEGGTTLGGYWEETFIFLGNVALVFVLLTILPLVSCLVRTRTLTDKAWREGKSIMNHNIFIFT